MRGACYWILHSAFCILHSASCFPSSVFSLPSSVRCLLPDLHFQNMGAVAAAIAIGATDEDVAEELHLDLLETGAAAPLTLALRRVEAEGTGVQAALLRQFRLGEESPNILEGADINSRIRPGGLAKNRLIHQHNPAEVL